jgi:hypothetical protein
MLPADAGSQRQTGLPHICNIPYHPSWDSLPGKEGAAISSCVFFFLTAIPPHGKTVY